MSHLDQPADANSMSADDLIDELDDRLERMTEADFDRAEIERILGLLEDRKPLRTQFDPIAAWDEMAIQHPLFFQEEAVNEASSPRPDILPAPARRPRRKPAMLRVALVAAVTLLTLLIAAQAMGLDVFGIMTRWTDEHFIIESTTSAVENHPTRSRPAENETVYFTTLEEALDTYGIDLPLLPKWLPEGYTYKEVSVTGLTALTVYNALLENQTETARLGVLIRETNPDMPRGTSVYEKDDSDVICYESNGIKHYIFHNVGNTIISWINHEFECSVDGFFTHEEAMKIIDSIYT